MMEQYQKDLTGHILTLEIKEYLDATNYEQSADEKLPALLPPNIFKKLSVKVEANITEHSLSYVFELWESLAIHFVLPQPAMILYGIAEGCVGITWLLPTNLVKYVTKMAQGSLDMFARQHIQRVMLEEQCIYSEPPLQTTVLKMKPDFNADEHPFERVIAGAQPSNPKQDIADELKSYKIRNVEALLEDKHVKGRGSFGAVYEVKANGVLCIAKRLHDILQGYGQHEAVSTQEKKTLCENFRRECIILSRLRHPNIVQFLGVYYGKHEGDLMLLMEYLHMDLDRCLTDNPNMPLPIKISILLDVSYGLLYLHTQIPAIIHRDLKAGNVLLTTDMQAKLADLGVAKISDLMTYKQSHTIAPGTNAVMPPEALQETPHYNYKLDVFSFGTLTLHVVTQEFPKVHEVPFEYIEKVEKGKMQIAKRMSVIREMSQDHCLYPLAMECLLDDQNKRPTTQSLNVRLKRLSEQHPRQFRDFLHMHRELQKQQEMQKKLKKELAESKSHSSHEMLKQQEMQKKLKKEMAESKSHSLHEMQLIRRELKDSQDEVQRLMKQVEQRDSEVIQMRSTCQELKQKINLLEKQVSKSTNKLAAMEEETSQLKAFNQDSVYRCEYLERILEERTSLIKKYQQSSSHRYKKLEEAASHARKQIEHLQAVLIEATHQDEAEIQTPAIVVTSCSSNLSPAVMKFSLRKLTPHGKQSVVLLSLHDSKLKLNEEAVLLLRTINKPVAILTICGPYRTGKSYFLSRLLGSPDAFKVGHTTESCTRGVWMGTTALECEEFVLLLLDTEGTDAIGESNSAGVLNLLVVTTLLSSCFIYNSTSVPRSTDLQKMSCFTHLSTTLIQDGSKQEQDLTDLQKYFPDFVWLIRDQSLKSQRDESGNRQTWTQYVKAKVLVRSENPCLSTSDEVVRVMLHLFPSLECKVIPHPYCDNPAETPDEVSPKFNAAIEQVAQELLSSVKLKPGLSASLDGSMLVNLAQKYVKALNSGENIIIEGILYATVIQKLDNLIGELVQQYWKKMVVTLEGRYPLEEGAMDDEEHPPTTLMAFHQQVFEECKLSLKQKADLYMPALNTASVDEDISTIGKKKTEILTKFQKRIYECEFIPGQGILVVRGELLQFVKKNKGKSNEQCTSLFEYLVQQQGDVRLTQLEQEYMAQAIGPAKREVFKQKAQWISGQPEDINVTEVTHSEVKITWKRPTVHTYAAWNYEVQRKEEGNEWISSDLTPKLFQVVTGLKPNVKYYLRVHGVNSHMHGNKGEWSEELTVTTPPGEPNKPQRPEIKLKSSTAAAILIWPLQPGDDNGSAVTHVIVESKLQGSPSKNTEFLIKSHEDSDANMIRDLTLDSATCDGFYCFRVSMKNDVGESEPSEWAKVATSELIPGPPQPRDDIYSKTNQVGLKWSQPQLHPIAVVKYELQMETTTGIWNTITETQSDADTVNDLKPNTKYRFRVRAVNENKEGEWSKAFEAKTTPGVPSKPSKPEVTITAPQEATITVQWLEEEDENGSPVTHVIIEKCMYYGFKHR